MKSAIAILAVLLAVLACAAGCTGNSQSAATTPVPQSAAAAPPAAPPGQGAAAVATTAGTASGPAPAWITVTPTVRRFDTSGAVNISVRKRVADPVMIVIKFEGGTQAGNIKEIKIGTANYDGIQEDKTLLPQVGQTVEIKGTDKPDRVTIWVTMNDGNSYMYLDEDI